MAARPPQRQTDVTSIEFGIAALIPLLEEHELQFPLTADELIEQLNDPDIPVDVAGRTISLSTALNELETTTYESQQELLNQLHPVFESYRENSSTTLIGSLRQMLPF